MPSNWALSFLWSYQLLNHILFLFSSPFSCQNNHNFLYIFDFSQQHLLLSQNTYFGCYNLFINCKFNFHNLLCSL